ncbi:NACHT domain-containing protein [Paenibacillus hemerocallicola]|uniref:NACHT domain-containing protein n=1 Tax=Paenibacillus hemerocallicola TaxID=1172614 RepID=A0A5C4SYQ2_9BACL|nr:pentapeptide repeat-containing protein [Paenibacillus hemerocallicola]TNJ59079.1 NACHT domain-containing protein [Paenibacillus hemerocallicola]
MREDQIKSTTGKIVRRGSNGGIIKTGTALLLDPYTALTARHIFGPVHESEGQAYVELQGGEQVYMEFPHLKDRQPIRVSGVVACPEPHLDVALVKLDMPAPEELPYPKLYGVSPGTGARYQGHGFPKDRPSGCLLAGEVIEQYESYEQNNVELSSDRGNGFDYSGASGSPLYIAGGVYGILLVQDSGNALGALTLSECAEFLSLHGVAVEAFAPLHPSEEAILAHLLPLAQVGIDKNEDLPYMETFAHWSYVTDLYREQDAKAADALKLEEMAGAFFSEGEPGRKERILYVVADFGKGKSTFLRHYAAKLARQYKQDRQGDFPIYFNLRDFKKYDSYEHISLSKLGCVGEFLKDSCNYDFDHGNDHPLVDKPVVLLVDSLDECGSLAPQAIKKVIQSVKMIRSKFKTVKMIVTSRPIPNALEQVIKENETVNDTWTYAAIYGFIPEQFAEYMSMLREKLESQSAYPYNQELLDVLASGIDIYGKFQEVLDAKELTRPILAYMLFKLLEQDYEIQRDSRLGVYLSFINLLTKDAKHVHDERKPDSALSYPEQLSYRNLLYATAVMWMKNRHIGGGGFLRLGDLTDVLGEDAALVEFMSHSYFKHDNDTYYFNHQSFAEIILAEYYIRVLLWAAIEGRALNEVRPYLNIGTPTTQTMAFVKGLLQLLADATANASHADPAELGKIRKSLFPLIATLGIKKFNSLPGQSNEKNYLFSSSVHDYIRARRLEDYTDVPDSLLRDHWPIATEHLVRCVELCAELVDEEEDYAFFEAAPIHTSYSPVYRITKRTREFAIDTDRWFAILSGVTLSGRLRLERDFLRLVDSETLGEMMRLYQLESSSICPEWIEELPGWGMENQLPYDLKGASFSPTLLVREWALHNVDLTGAAFYHTELAKVSLSKTNLDGASFDNVYARELELFRCDGKGATFNNCRLENIELKHCDLRGVTFHEAFMIGASFHDVDLRGAELTALYMIDIEDFTGVKLGGNRISIMMDRKSFDRWRRAFGNYYARYVTMADDSQIEYHYGVYKRNTGRDKHKEIMTPWTPSLTQKSMGT